MTRVASTRTGVRRLLAAIIAQFVLAASAHAQSPFTGQTPEDADGRAISPAAAETARFFLPFAPKVSVGSDEDYLLVESDGMPDHRMMVGITAWQQQVPIPQPYVGDNGWQIPLHPVPTEAPLSAKEHFFRGAIALAANGIPIFNPIKNDRVTDTFLAGELDEYGGHSGRGDDYHYHISPLHLQEALGTELPVAYALDGYAIYGLTEPDGSSPGELDPFNGHATQALVYHYHSTTDYPYLNGGFHGQVVEFEGQVDPQPRTAPVRPATRPLRGATIVGFTSPRENYYSLVYTIGEETRFVNWLVGDTDIYYEFIDGGGNVENESYSRTGPRPTSGGNPTRYEQPSGMGMGAGMGMGL